MAMSRDTTRTSLTIALIVFVLLTFVLAITTYLVFTKQFDAEKVAMDADIRTREAKSELDTAIADKSKLQEFLGVAEDTTIEDVETEINETFEKKFGDFNGEQKNFLKLSDWLLGAIQEKDEQLKVLEADKSKLDAEKTAAMQEAEKKLAALAAQVQEKEKTATQQKQAFDKDRSESEVQSNDLLDKQKTALQGSTRLESLIGEIKTAKQYLSPSRQTKFEAQEAEGQLRVLYDELKERKETIEKQNEVLAELRVSDKALQTAVLAATPKDNRVDGIDGRIINVNEADRSVLIDCGSTQGLRTGMVLFVYNPIDPRPELGSKKGVVEVVGIESSSVAKARVRQDSTHDPILSGDAVATSLWARGKPFESVIVGFIQIDGDEKQDQERLAELVARVGGTLETQVSPSTTMVVDAGLPKKKGTAKDRAPGWRPADEVRRDRQIKEARSLGIRVVGLDAFLEMLGLERDSLDSNSLTSPGERRAPPVRGENVAY